MIETEGRAASRRVLAEQAATWGAIWEEALAIQRRNPDVYRMAEAKTTDPKLAIEELVPALILLHPQVAASVTAFCHAIEAEFGFPAGKPVAPVAYGPGVAEATAEEVNHLRAENDELRARLALVETSLTAAAGAVLATFEEPLEEEDELARARRMLAGLTAAAGAIIAVGPEAFVQVAS